MFNVSRPYYFTLSFHLQVILLLLLRKTTSLKKGFGIILRSISPRPRTGKLLFIKAPSEEGIVVLLLTSRFKKFSQLIQKYIFVVRSWLFCIKLYFKHQVKRNILCLVIAISQTKSRPTFKHRSYLRVIGTKPDYWNAKERGLL